MGTHTTTTEAPFKYTKDSFIGVRDAWISYAAGQISKAAAALEQYADKLPAAVKNKIPRKSKSDSTTSTGANAPS